MSAGQSDGAETKSGGSQAALQGWLRALELTSRLGEHPLTTLPVAINEQAGVAAMRQR